MLGGRRLRARALADRQRPAYHFVAPAGWLNDPNGATQRDGAYHLFYQHNPRGAFHWRIRWGHARSTDLVHWEDRPIALRPRRGGPDAGGCWSGVLVHGDDGPVIVYSGRKGRHESACIAFGDATLDDWRTHPGNPVIAGPPAEADVTAFRDHCVWRENGRWRQLIGSGMTGAGGCAFLYESDDLITWHELGALVVGDAASPSAGAPDWTGTMWECVDLFRFCPDGTTAAPDAASGDAHLLVFSAWDRGLGARHSMVARGRYRDDRFEIEGYQRLDLGNLHAYAPQTFADESGRRVLWAWMQEGRSGRAQVRAGWSGAMTLPRRVWLGSDGVVRQEPVAELEALRGEPVAWREDGALTVANGREVELGCDLRVAPGATVSLSLLATPDRAEQTVVELTRSLDGRLRVALDRSRSSLDHTTDRSPTAGDVPWGAGVLPLRVFIDRSCVEVFVAGIALSTRAYPTREDATGITVRTRGDAVVHGLRGWVLAGVEQVDRVVVA